MAEIFERAARLKLRFETEKGYLDVEDLWDLPLTGRSVSLDGIAVGLHRKLQDATPVSFVNDSAEADPTLQLRFDLVKRVIDVRMEESRAALAARDRAEKKQRIMGLIAKKQDEELAGKSTEELEALLADL